MEFVIYRHSFNSGDLITILPGMKKIYHETGKKAIIFQRIGLPANYGHNDNHPILSDEGRMVCMNEKMFNMLKPLIEAQEYVERFEVWQGEQIDVDYDLTRQNSVMPLPNGPIHGWASLIFPQLEGDLTEPWIKVNDVEKHSAIVINRTERYQNPYISYFFLKDYEGQITFVGTQRERDLFCKDYNFDLPLIQVDNFYELAKYIAGCKFFIGNQSMCFHLSDSMKVPRILEVCSTFPNTFPTGKNGYAFLMQQNLEFYFHQLLNELNKQDEKIR